MQTFSWQRKKSLKVEFSTKLKVCFNFLIKSVCRRKIVQFRINVLRIYQKKRWVLCVVSNQFFPTFDILAVTPHLDMGMMSLCFTLISLFLSLSLSQTHTHKYRHVHSHLHLHSHLHTNTDMHTHLHTLRHAQKHLTSINACASWYERMA